MKPKAAQMHASASTEEVQSEPAEFVFNGIPPELADSGEGEQLSSGHPLRMYTEEEVASMLQVPLSQFRKRSRHQNRDSVHPPLLFSSAASAKMPTRAANVAHRKPPESVKVALESKLLVSRGEAAQLLSISERGVDYLIAARRLPTKRIGGRVLIPVAELRKYARSDHPERIVS